MDVSRQLAILATLGLDDAMAIGAGMEAAAFAVNREQVVKLWHQRSVAEVARLQAFYEAIGRQHPPFLVPHITNVTSIDVVTVSFEAKLPGVTLQRRLDEGLAIEGAVAVIAKVLEQLRSIAPTDALKSLPVLDDAVGIYTNASTWGAAIASLVERRFERSYEVFLRAVPNASAIAVELLSALQSTLADERLIHGDLVPGNILVDEHDEPSAVLDFGYLSLVGDACFDAAIASAVFDMYSPTAPETRAYLQTLLQEQLGYASSTTRMYLAAYGFITGTSYDATGADGHFAWCVERIREYARTL